MRNRGASIINILGLSIGLACYMLILVYVINETSYDQFHSKSERLFRFTTIDQALGVSSNHVAITNPRMPAAAREEISEVVNATRMIQQGRIRMEVGEDIFYSEHAKYVEKNFFEMFDYSVVPDGVQDFHQPRKLILTESMAHTIFGDGPSIKKVVEINDEPWEVVGILEEDTENSHLGLDVLMAMYPTEADSSIAQYIDSWQGLGMIGYAELNDAANEKSVEESMKKLAADNEVNNFWIPQLQPLTDIHLGSSDILFDNYHVNKGDRVYVYSMSAVAIFILLIAAFNFMNLSTAKSSIRAKEVGIRKVMGGSRRTLIGQHLGESVILVLISTGIAFILVLIVSPFLTLGLNENFEMFLWNHPEAIGIILLSSLVIGLLSGIYPAFVLSGFNTAIILRGKFKGNRKGIGLRKGLVILQFTASIVLITATIFVFRQLDFIKNKDLGFNKDQIVTFQMSDPGLAERVVGFRDGLNSIEGIEKVSMSGNMPGRTFGRTGITPEGQASGDDDDLWIVSVLSFDSYFLDMMNMELVEGRNFNEGSEADQNGSLLVNEAFVEQVGWENGVGKTVTLGGNQERRIVGVVKDFHFANMKHNIEPLIMFYSPNNSNSLSFLISGENIESVMNRAQVLWTEVYPDYPFEYEFFDQEFDEMFKSDEQFSRLISSFTWLAIFIACLGLLGLSSYMADQRRKEIGVRKVLGSSVTEVMMLLSREFLLLIGIAMIIAWPVAYWAVSNWLGEFQYRIDLLSISNVIVFLLSGFAALIIGILTVSYQSMSAALINPVKALKEE
jgi:putative ABC transport system permease protein